MGFQRSALLSVENPPTPVRFQKIEQSGCGNKPSVLSGKPLHSLLELGMKLAVLHKSVSEMRVHDAGASLFLEPVLVAILDSLEKCIQIVAFGCGEPLVHVRPQRIRIRHPRAHPKRIYIGKDEIAAIADLLLTNVAPECRMAFDMSEKSTAVRPAGCKVVRHSAPPRQPRVSPINGFFVVVIGH